MTTTALNPRFRSPWLGRCGGRKGGFSLTELLVVMVILMILMVAAAPVFVKSGQRARQGARELVKGHLQRARAHAIANGKATAVIVPDYSSGADLGGKMLGIAEVNWVSTPENPSGSYQITQLLQRWESLPGSVLVMSQSVSRHPRPTVMELSLRAPMTIARRPITGAVIVFSSTGQIVSPAGGVMEIVLGQGKVTGGQLAATEKNGNKVSYDLLQINRLTGRARQLDPP
ncbi:MAG: pilus assembly FimT family protein [Akkermansiaceae bacterium]